jgi:hypothetical protein
VDSLSSGPSDHHQRSHGGLGAMNSSCTDSFEILTASLEENLY